MVAEVFQAKKLLDYKHDQVLKACRSLYEGLITLTVEYKNQDPAIPDIADISDRSLTGEYKPDDQALMEIVDVPR